MLRLYFTSYRFGTTFSSILTGTVQVQWTERSYHQPSSTLAIISLLNCYNSLRGNTASKLLKAISVPPANNLPDFGVDIKASGISTPDHHGPSPGITFDRFVRVCVVIKTATESFQRLDTDRDGWIQINYDQFMHTVLSAPWINLGNLKTWCFSIHRSGGRRAATVYCTMSLYLYVV